MDEIPNEVLWSVLNFVPAKHLLRSCTRVCKKWHFVISDNMFWKQKCSSHGRLIPFLLDCSDVNIRYDRIFVLNPFGRNLVKNGNASENLKHWNVEKEGGDGFRVEDPPAGSDPLNQVLPVAGGRNKCWATSYGDCSKYQIINLIKEGVNKDILDKIKPPIKIKECYAGRFDCGCIFQLKVQLLDANQKEIDVFTFEDRIDQWQGRDWHTVSHTFKDYKKGLRYIRYKHYGKDTQFWSGHYGSKFTLATVQFV